MLEPAVFIVREYGSRALNALRDILLFSLLLILANVFNVLFKCFHSRYIVYDIWYIPNYAVFAVCIYRCLPEVRANVLRNWFSLADVFVMIIQTNLNVPVHILSDLSNTMYTCVTLPMSMNHFPLSLANIAIFSIHLFIFVLSRPWFILFVNLLKHSHSKFSANTPTQTQPSHLRLLIVFVCSSYRCLIYW